MKKVIAALLGVWLVASPCMAKEIAILDILSGAHVSAFLSWDPVPGDRQRRFRCLVTRGEGGGELLEVYQSTGRENRLLFGQKVGERLLALFPTSEPGGDLVAVSISGANIRTSIFSYDHGKVKRILEAEGKGFPDFVRGERDEKPTVILRTGPSRDPENHAPTVIYRWNGKGYFPSEPSPPPPLPEKSRPPVVPQENHPDSPLPPGRR